MRLESEIAMNNTVFIHADQLGVLSQQVRDMALPTHTKRARQSDFGRMVKLLKNLRLINPTRAVLYIAYGVNNAGHSGLLVVYESPQQEVGVTQPKGDA